MNMKRLGEKGKDMLRNILIKVGIDGIGLVLTGILIVAAIMYTLGV